MIRPRRQPNGQGGGQGRPGGGRPGGGERREGKGGPDRGGDRGGDRRPQGGGERRFDGPPEIELDKLIGDSLYLDNQAHIVVSRMRDMDSGTRSQLRRLYNAVRRATRAPAETPARGGSSAWPAFFPAPRTMPTATG